MESFSWNQDISSKNDYPNSLDNRLISSSINFIKEKTPKKNNFKKSRNLLKDKYKTMDFNYLVKYVHQYFLSFYKNDEKDYNIRMIEDILDNEETHLVAEFKDFLVMGDMNEFLQKYYKVSDSKRCLPKICDYYLKASQIFPNYFCIEENKYIYKNIRKKQKLIDNQQEQEENQKKNKKCNHSESIDEFFTSKTLNSILQQTNTSNVKLIFGMNDENNKSNMKNENKIDEDETPNKIIENLEEIEKELESNKNKLKENMGKDNSYFKLKNSPNNNNKFGIYPNDKNKKMNLLKFNISNTSSNVSTRPYKRNNSKNRIINNYLSKKVNTEGNSKNYIKSNSIISGTESDYIKKKCFNYFINNTNKSNIRNLIMGNCLNKNKSIIHTHQNSLIPSKACISKFFTNNNNYTRSALKFNSFNFITKNLEKRNNKNFVFSSSLHTLQANPVKKKNYYNLNININNSNSAKNMNNRILKSKSNEYISSKEKEKIMKNKDNECINNLNINNHHKRHHHTLSLTINILNYKNKNKTKQKNITERNYDNQIHIRYTKNKINTNNLKTSGNSKNNKNIIEKIINPNKKKIINGNIKINGNVKSNKKNNYLNHIKLKNLNLQKIISLTNIQKTIKISNKKTKKVFINHNSGENIFSNKIFPLSPLSVKFDSEKSSSTKKTLNLKNKKNKNNIYKNINTNNIFSPSKHFYIDSIINSPKNRQHVINQGAKNKLISEELNKKKNIILPYKKEINIINININGYNSPERGSVTSRDSKNQNNKKLQEYKGRNKAEINFYNQEIKVKSKNKNQNNINKNNLIARNDKSNPIIIRSIFDNIVKNKNSENQVNSGFFTSRK